MMTGDNAVKFYINKNPQSSIESCENFPTPSPSLLGDGEPKSITLKYETTKEYVP